MDVLCPRASAIILYWNTTGGVVNTGGGAGTWDTGISSFWTASPAGGPLITWTSDSDAFFVNAAGNAVTLSGLVELNSLQQETNGTITIISPTSSADTLQIDGNTGILNGIAPNGTTVGGGALTINSAVTLNNTNITIGAQSGITITGPIGDGGNGYGFTKVGAGTLTLNTSASAYTGPTIVEQGVLLLNDPGLTGVSPLVNSPVVIGNPSAGLNFPELIITETAADANTVIPRPSVTINSPNVTATTQNAISLDINATGTGNTVESFPSWTMKAGDFRAFLNPASGANLQVDVTNIVRSPGAVLQIVRDTANTVINLGRGPITNLAAGQVNLVFNNPPALSGGGGAADSPTISVLPWACVAGVLPVGIAVGTEVPATYDPANGLRGLNTNTEMVALSSSATGAQNTVIPAAGVTLAGNTSVNSLWGPSGTVTLGGNTLSILSGTIVANGSCQIGISPNDGFLAFGANEAEIFVANARILTIDSVITGTGGMTIGLDNLNQSAIKSNVVLNAANTISGITRIVGNSAPIIDAEVNNTLALQNTTLDYNNYGAFLSFGSITAATFGGLEGAQSLALPVALTIGGDGDSTTYSGALSGAGSLIKSGPGSFTLTGTNTYTGGTTLASGQLNINYGGNSSANSAVGSGTLTLQSGTFDNTSGAPITLAANNPQIWNGSFAFNGSSALNLGSGAVTLQGNSQLTVNAGTLSVGGGISGLGYSLTLAGNGVLALGGNSTYSGDTAVNGGTLALSGSAAIGASPAITIASGAKLDVSALSSTFTLASGQKLFAGGTVNGSVAASSGSSVYAGADGSFGANTFNNNLALASGATANFDLGDSASGPNDLLTVSGNLALNGNTLHIKAPSASASLDTADYTLFMVSGTTSGSFAATPAWDVQPSNFSHYTVVTSGNTVKLHYSNNSLPEGAASFSPSTVGRGQKTLLTVTVTQGTFPISSVTLDASPVGGSSTLALIQAGGGNTYTNSITVGGSLPGGSQVMLTVSIADNQSDVTLVPASLSILAGVSTWTGTAGDSLWSDNGNWAGGVGPLSGDAVVFAGSQGQNPVLDQSYSLSSVTFSNASVSFVITDANGASLTLNRGITNNSALPQTLDVPILLNTAQTFSTAAGDLSVGGVISGVTSALTNSGNGALTLSASNTYGGGATVASGALVVANNAALGAGTLTLAGGSISNAAGVNYTVPNTVQLTGASSVVVGTNDTLALSGQISGPGSFTELGGGSLFLPSVNNFTGGMAVSQSILDIGNSSALGAGVLTLEDGSVITNAAGGNYVIPNSIDLAGQAAISVETNTGFSFSGPITNAGSLTLNGSGRVSFIGTSTNAYTGGIVVFSGVLDVENPHSPLGMGTLTLAGGSLEDNSGTSVTLSNNITAQAGTASTLINASASAPILNLAGNISGSGSLNLIGTVGGALPVMELSGNNAGFTGTFTANPDSVYQVLQFGSPNAGSANATWIFALPNGYGLNTTSPSFTFGSGTISFGSLSSSPATGGGNWLFQNPGNGIITLEIGALESNDVFDAVLPATGNLNILKVGAAETAFNGNSPGFNGLDEVAGGTNEITTAWQTASQVQVDNGGTFGVIDVFNQKSAQVGSMAVNPGANLFIDQPYFSGLIPLNLTGSMTVNGVCTVTVADPGALNQGGVYPLIGYTNSSGSGHFVLNPLANGLAAGIINDPANGGLLITLPLTFPLVPTNLTFSTTRSSGMTTLNLTWPSTYLGWALQSNNVSLSDDTAWGLVSGSEFTNGASITVNPGQKSAFFRLALP
jgi:autotransporter-associated beta strand protein